LLKVPLFVLVSRHLLLQVESFPLPFLFDLN
jgi:hypothetical protein